MCWLFSCIFNDSNSQGPQQDCENSHVLVFGWRHKHLWRERSTQQCVTCDIIVEHKGGWRPSNTFFSPENMCKTGECSYYWNRERIHTPPIMAVASKTEITHFYLILPSFFKNQPEFYQFYLFWSKVNYWLTFADRSWIPFCGSGESPPDGPRSSHPGWRSTGWGCWVEPPGMLFLLWASLCRTTNNEMCLRRESCSISIKTLSSLTQIVACWSMIFFFFSPATLLHLSDGLLSFLPKMPHLFWFPREKKLPIFFEHACLLLQLDQPSFKNHQTVVISKTTSNILYKLYRFNQIQTRKKLTWGIKWWICCLS